MASIRRPCRGTLATPSTTYSAVRLGARYYMQHRQQILGQHGADLIKHQSIADQSVPKKVAGFHNVVAAAPAADLFRTPLHEGLGTSARDPYERTLPNMESRPPESTVLHSIAPLAPTLEDVERLHMKWESLQVWIGETHKWLRLFLESQQVTPSLPVSPTAAALLEEFSTNILPTLSSAAEDAVRLQKWWNAVQDAYESVASKHLFDRERFTAALERIHRDALSSARQRASPEQLEMALEVLRRRAVLTHNESIEVYLSLVSRGQISPHEIWDQFLRAMREHKGRVFVRKSDATLLYAWSALVAGERVQTPAAMTAPVALFFFLSAILFRQEAHRREDGVREKERGSKPQGEKEEAVTQSASSSPAQSSCTPPFTVVRPTTSLSSASELAERLNQTVDIQSRRKFVAEELSRLVETPALLGRLGKVFYEEKEYELHRDLCMYEAMQDDTLLRRAEAESLAAPFEHLTEVKTLFASIHSGSDVHAKHHLCTTLNISMRASQVSWEETLEAAQWTTEWRKWATILLMDTSFLKEAHRHMTNAIAAKGIERRLFQAQVSDSLGAVAAARQRREKMRSEMLQQLTRHLSSYEMVHRSVRALLRVGVSAATLEEAAAAEQQQLAPQEIPKVSIELFYPVLTAVALRHPNWVKAKVMTAPPESLDFVAILRLMTRFFVRLTYIPQAGAAMIAQNTRRRIGPVGLETTQYNIPAEFGMVEQFDNLQYKRYDWQGWYQRMVDVHNRNVSLRCRLGDLKHLDAEGNPFVDLQTERRLRILCKERVGMGVVKLDSDKYEDQADNITYGTTKMSEVLAESRKAQLGPEYWPTVEVKVRKPSGQSKAYYSIIDDDRIEKQSKQLYERYKEIKKRKMFVTPMDLWLNINGAHQQGHADTQDPEGYSVTSLHDTLQDS